jgi:hypothetical protein
MKTARNPLRFTPGNWMCNRAEICAGDHQSASQLVTWAASRAWTSFGVVGDHGKPQLEGLGDQLIP